MNSNFIDHVNIFFRSGNGGPGSVHFRQEKHVEKGGPDGGNGGQGASIILRGSTQHWTLLHLKYRKHIHADNGAGGEGGRRSGKDGKDIIIEVPLGTIARDTASGEKLIEVLEDGEELVLLPGGKGGLGNENFKTSTNQAPRFAQPGQPGLEAWITLELKLLADVGLVGFPNAGKSTLLSVISAATPEVGDYAFTTLVPNLGVVEYRDHQSFVMADIPGIIEGAAEGKGIGIRFLRHIERNSSLLFMVSCDAKSINEEYEILLNELRKYNPELLDKNRLLAVTKCDMIDEEMQNQMKADLPKGVKTVFISAMTQKGLTELKDTIWQSLLL